MTQNLRSLTGKYQDLEESYSKRSSYAYVLLSGLNYHKANIKVVRFVYDLSLANSTLGIS